MLGSTGVELDEVVLGWVRATGLLDTPRPHVPGATRLVQHCLVPLVHDIVSPRPSGTYRARVLDLLDAAHDGLVADLDALSADLAVQLDGMAPGLPGVRWSRLLDTDAVQSRAAAALREVLRPEWTRAMRDDDTLCDNIEPAWGQPASAPARRELADNLSATLLRNRCKAWAMNSAAESAQEFRRVWGSEVDEALAGAAADRVSGVDAGLGDLDLPDPTRSPPAEHGWTVAIDRSFHNRIRLYWDGRSLPRGDGGRLPDERFADHPEPGKALVRESIDRTVQPMGLSLAVHRALANVVAAAVAGAAERPRERRTDPGVAAVWDAVAHGAPSSQDGHALDTVVSDFARHYLVTHAVDTAGWDHDRYGRCVARRVWLRLHAWELAAAPIPGRELQRSLSAGLDKARSAAGVAAAATLTYRDDRRSKPTRGGPADHRDKRADASITLVAQIRAEMADPTPESVVAEYRRRYSRLRRDPDASTRGLMAPAQVERLLRGEDLP